MAGAVSINGEGFKPLSFGVGSLGPEVNNNKSTKMIKNYLKIAFRNLWRHKAFSFLNIMGLTVGWQRVS